MCSFKRGKREIKIQITEDEINKRIDQIEALSCDQDLRQFLIDALELLIELDRLVGMKETTILRLRKIFDKKNEKSPREETVSDPNAPHPRGNNKGKNGKENYPNAQKVKHTIKDLKKGEKCPACQAGRVYPVEPGIYIQIKGSPVLKAVINETEKLRCNGCGKIFEADFAGKGEEKYDPSSKAIVAVMKYSASMPFYRLEKIQKHFMTPMPSSTQWDLMEDLANQVAPVFESLCQWAANGEKIHIDDTTGKILTLIKENKSLVDKKDRKGIKTTGIRSERDGKKAVLYFTGRNYSGENLEKLLERRDSSDPLIIMSDALNQNNVDKENTLKSLCLAHGRRRFKDLEDKFETQSSFVIDKIKEIYKNDKHCLEKNLSKEERLAYHQEHSSPFIDELYKKFEFYFETKEVEPNSSLGEAISYMLNHREGLTAFLRVAGAPLDNNILEQNLRVAVLNRKNWLFYKTETGALIGDILTGLIKTCEENGKNPFEYLIALQKNRKVVKELPEKWLPWENWES